MGFTKLKMKLKSEYTPGGGYAVVYENGEFVSKVSRGIHCERDELQTIKDYVNSRGKYGGHLGIQFPDDATTYETCFKVLEAHPKHKTVGKYLLSLARVDDPERSSDLEKLLLRPAHQTKLGKKK